MKLTKTQIKRKIKLNKELIETIYASYEQAKSIGDVWGAKNFDKNMARVERENDKLEKQIKEGI
jgi:hypothetical protein